MCGSARIEWRQDRPDHSGRRGHGVPGADGGAYPVGITTGPDGNLWFAERNADKIGRLTPSGAMTEFPVPTRAASPDKILPGPDGSLWFTEHGSDELARITP